MKHSLANHTVDLDLTVCLGYTLLLRVSLLKFHYLLGLYPPFESFTAENYYLFGFRPFNHHIPLRRALISDAPQGQFLPGFVILLFYYLLLNSFCLVLLYTWHGGMWLGTTAPSCGTLQTPVELQT